MNNLISSMNIIDAVTNKMDKNRKFDEAMAEDDKREERRIENQEYQEECKHEIDNAAEELRGSDLI